MSEVSSSKNGSGNGKSSGFFGFLRRSVVEPEMEPSAAASAEDLFADVDAQIEGLQRADQRKHEEILGTAKQIQRNGRCAQLRVKRLNGGLTAEEEVELAQEC